MCKLEEFSKMLKSDKQVKLANLVVLVDGGKELVGKYRGVPGKEVVELTVDEFNEGVKYVNGQVIVDEEFYSGKDFYISL